MRKVGTLVAAVLLAAAAGAGEGVSWKRSDEIPFVPLTEDASAASAEYDDVCENYSVSWMSVLPGSEIDFIEATFYGWGLHCSRLKKAVADGKVKESELPAEAEKAKSVFRNFLIFYVTISARERADADLADPDRWTVYLEREGTQLAPAVIDVDKNAPRKVMVRELHDAVIPEKYAGKTKFTAEELRDIRVLDSQDIVWCRKTFKIAFVNPYREPPRENLRLVITGEKAQHGFEWRFKE
ncbi:MAG: hypothetical protein JSU81_02660 [Candidatus Coatesbacteria bacterium]|nr:MAG: hypothetical protein JSU81_02660 [Candidatus Coatesbacteria bacterium]